MNIKNSLTPSSIILKSHVNRYTFLGLAIAVSSILIASLIVSYQMTGYVSLAGFIEAQRSNPAIWVLDLTPFMFVYWGQAFCEGLVNRAQTLLVDQTREFLNISGNLELKLRYESNHDNLTSLPNSRMLSEQIKLGMEQLGTQGQLALIIIKINDFQNINYNFGTFNANSVLKQFADQLKNLLIDPYMLQVSIGINLVARLQSDEFAFLLPRLKKDFNANELLGSMLNLIPSNYGIDGFNINITTTAGIAIYPFHGQDEVTLINHASIAVYHARKDGRPYAIYSPEMQDDLTQNRIMINELKRSIEHNELEIQYLPIFNLASGQIIGAESHVRFEHPEYGILSPEKFIPLVEGTSLIQQLTEFMLKGVIQQIANWHSEGYKLSASVNLSVKDASDKELPGLIEELLHRYKVSPASLILEFTERACLTEQTIAKEVLGKLAAIGIQLSIEDFCSGDTSFIYLTNYPINEVKIEKSYIFKMTHDPKKIKIVETIIKIANTLGLKTKADGIADQETLDKLKQLGCLSGQGIYFSHPINANEFKSLLDKKLPR
ncbi:putative bifunctional diguanylate cyclase/phosphodiesterase [Legionella bononiensis]|uniref:Bifunctional diguanylate cyclase/phosphodiesterase n=1 Tax=Legionella bononiensis TaxID=2793102 RepID=A0ABS1WDU1_9GAMM|nr:bifunctional diguanylate cyclase/phosphodiesterase [Legionella bononiensis]MBL7481495.1 bifunctional diguanylate cyclase/phosphodiesterase [Legionella bononiensis]MBL7527527.1 bifunctional diguanylate cyclase/phosphodiesterase [Legionella bononiensis]